MTWTIQHNDLNLLGVKDSEDEHLIITATYPSHQCGLTPKQASLIASAPDMYEALKKVRELMYGLGLDDRQAMIAQKVIEVIKRSMAKAEGK